VPIKPSYLLLAGGGAVVAYAGIRGKGIGSAIRSVIAGQPPAKAAQTTALITPANYATGTGSGGIAGGVVPPGGVSSGSGYRNMVTVAKYLMSNGYSRAAAAGIAGCIAGESGGDPESQGSGGNGLIGWTPPLAGAVTGNPSRDLAFQMAAILDYNNAQGSGLIAQLNAQPNALAAAMFYSKRFERPLVTYSDVRPVTAAAVYAALS
jgi:hypothetical protein